MHVRENYKAQLPSHIKRINGKIVLQLGNWDESIELKREHTHHSVFEFSALINARHISGSVLRFCPPFPFPALPVSCHKPWPSWTSGLTGWTDQEILMLVARPDFCCQGDTCTCTNWKDVNVNFLESSRVLPHIWSSHDPTRIFKQLTATWAVHGGIP